MPRINLTPPPGVVKKGTIGASRDKWYDTVWVRWFEGVMQAIGGFEPYPDLASQVDHGEPVRGTHAWRDNSGNFQFIFGGPTTIDVLNEAGQFDVTPVSGFTTGGADAVQVSGTYGNASTTYGEGPYGEGDPLAAALVEAQTYQMDNYGEDIVWVAYSDGGLYYMDLDGNAGNPAKSVLVAASAGSTPSSNRGVVVTPENFLMVLGAGGNPRRIQWPDQDPTGTGTFDWTTSDPVLQGGFFDLPGKGSIVAGRRAQAETLVWTQTELFSIRYIGGDFVYTPVPVGNVGAISRRCMAVVGSVAYWMGPRGFYIYNGFTQAIDSPLADYVFKDLNRTQASKIWAETRLDYGEITWHYPSGTSTECDRSVTLNFEEGFWFNNPTVARTGGEDSGALPFPVAFDPDGLLYKHEVGASYGGLTPGAVSGPISLGNGDVVMHMQSLVPDENTLGDVELSVKATFHPTDLGTLDEETFGPFTPREPTDSRLVGRYVRLVLDQVNPGWRVGQIQAIVQPGGER